MTSLNKLNSGRRGPKKKISKSGYTLVSIIIISLGCFVLIQAFRWQVLQRDRFLALASQQYENTAQELPQRGKILAKDGTILAVDEPVWNVFASLSSEETERKEFFSKKEDFVSEVATILGITIEEINSKITTDFRYIKLAEGISNEKKTALESIDVFNTHNLGLYFEKDVKRSYPNNSLASHVLGFIGKNSEGEYIGQYGIEGYYFSSLW